VLIGTSSAAADYCMAPSESACLEVEPRRLNVLRMQLATVPRGSPATPARLKRIKRPCGRGARSGKTMVVFPGTRRITRLVSGA
jgi:hypothetical protein